MLKEWICIKGFCGFLPQLKLFLTYKVHLNDLKREKFASKILSSLCEGSPASTKACPFGAS